MNNTQLDMVLGYLNEGIEIDQEEFLIESSIDVNIKAKETRKKLRVLESRYKKAAKKKDIDELNKIYSEIMQELNDAEKDIKAIKVSAIDTAATNALFIGWFGGIIWAFNYCLTGFWVKAGATVGIAIIERALETCKEMISRIKKEGVSADTLNLYKSRALEQIKHLKQLYEKMHKRYTKDLKN